MRNLFFALAVICLSVFPKNTLAQDTYVDGYTTNSGTYVQPHYRSAPDGNVYNNYSTQGNTNPYTGERGHQSPNTYNQPSQNFGGSYGGGGSFGNKRESMGGNGRPGRLY